MVTDASNVGLGGVLLQEDKPCAFESKKFTSTECNYHTTEREMLATVHCYKKWAVYLRENPKNVIETDHMPNTYFSTKPLLSSKEMRWMEFLSSFPGEWKYKPGKGNIADPLSRMPSFYVGAIIRKNKPAKAIVDEVIQPVQQFTLIQQILKGYLQDADFPKEKYLLQGDLYYHNDKIVIPNIPEVKELVIQECHDSMFAGHMGRDKTITTVKRLFWWKGMAQDITQYVTHCHVCQTTKAAATAGQGELHPMEATTVPWQNISVDLITALPLTIQGHDSIITVVDRCTKMVILIPTDMTIDAIRFAQKMQDHVYAKQGLPLDIVHDRDPRFIGNFLTTAYKGTGIHQSMTSAWHPESDGQTERMNRTVEQVLRAHSAESPREWDKLLSMVEFAINNSTHASLKDSPFFLNYGRHPITPVMIDFIKHDKVACAKALQWNKSNKQAFDFAMQQLKMARDRYKSYADSNRKDTTFKGGDKVLLSTVNLNKHSQNRKLFPKFIGPFKITERINDVSYRLDLPEMMKIHNAFHVSLLRLYKQGMKHPPPPIPIEMEGELEYEVQKIVSHREYKKTNKLEYYIMWSGYGPEHCTWEPEVHLKNAKDTVQDYWEALALLERAAKERPRSKQTLKRLQPDIAAISKKRKKAVS